MKYKKLQKNRGFVILYAVTLAAILLAIALGVINIAWKEVRFGTSAKDTNNAFFAADVGVECALMNDKSTTNLFVTGTSPNLTCNGVNNITATETAPSSSKWNFVLDMSSTKQGCAKVTVDKSISPVTTITAKGKNISDSSCVATNSNTVERELKTSYSGTPATVTAPPVFRSSTQAIGSVFATPSVTINKPAGVMQYDVLIATIAIRPSTATVTPPSGWNLLIRTDNGGTLAENGNAPGTLQPNSLITYYKVAGSSEPANYVWTMPLATSIVGGIVAFSGANTTTPVLISSGQTGYVGLTSTTPSISTIANTVIITAHAFASSSTWIPPAGMTEAVDVRSATGGGGESMEINYVVQATAGSTGAKTATASFEAGAQNDAGNAQILSLQP